MMNFSPRTKFLMLIGLFAVPVIAAYIAYFGLRPSGHNNYGELIKVTPLQHTSGKSLDGKSVNLADLKGQWWMVVVAPSACGAVCQRQLYLTRQVRLTQGKEQSRISRLWVLEDSGVPAAELLKAHPGLVVWRPDHVGFTAQFPATGEQATHIYLLDPLGNLMLRFPANPEPKRMMKDLKLLLKASQIG